MLSKVFTSSIISLLFNSLLVFNSISYSYCQNQAPRFEPSLHSNYFFPEYNATKPNDVLLWLNATDFDDDVLDFGVEGDFYKNLIHIKKIDNKHAVVIANQIFDREVQEKYENIVFYVQDPPGNKVYQSVRFVILDIDDNMPIFRNTPYKISIPEDQPINTVIFNSVEAYDADGPLYNKFTFSLSNNDYNGMFSIDKANYINSGQYNTSIILKKSLDYEKSKSHVITIYAIGENSVYTSSTELLINVIDVPNRPPEFSQSPYYVKIEEEMKLGAFVLQIYAKDGDSGINNPCKYEIINDKSPGSDYFKIDKITGYLYINKRIDLESSEIIKLGGLLEFKVKATEIGDENSSRQTQVTVAISDINDNQPTFNKNSYNLVISPKSTVGTSLTLTDPGTDSIRVSDLDKGINGSFSLILLRVLEMSESSTLYDNYSDFEVVPKLALNDANLIIKVKNQTNLMKKIGSVEHYQLFAKDNGLNGNITHVDLFVKIELINQYAPQFQKEFYVFNLDENSPYNTTINYMRATDNDTVRDYGTVYYELKNGQDRFQIDRFTGRVFTISRNPTQQLDRELIDTFYMSVDAVDGGGLRTSSQLIIKLNDLNDNAPQFINNALNVNGFSSLNIEGLSGNILIGLIEENSQKWLEPIRLQATDRDLGMNAKIVFQIEYVDFYFQDYFIIDPKKNTIRLAPNKTLDFEEVFNLRKNISGHNLNPGEIDLNLVIVAHDLGTPMLSSKMAAKVIIKDVNDHKPKFDRMFFSTKIPETAVSGIVYKVRAVDLDAPNTPNSKIFYRIESGSKDKFLIDSNTGIIKINENANLDRDLFGSFYTLKIIANDYGSVNINDDQTTTNSPDRNNKNLTGSDKTNNICYLMIEIIDVNNKKPEFVTDNELISIYESLPLNTLIIQMRAIDADMNANLSYFFIENGNKLLTNQKNEAIDENQKIVDFNLVKKWFRIESDTGSIRANAVIDRELVEFVTLVVGVEDLNADPNFRPQISLTTLKIRILDVNDNYPSFVGLNQINFHHSVVENEEPIFELYDSVEENTKINTKLVQLKAIDIDKDRNITYRIIHSTDSNNAIGLNRTTGDLYVNGLIDYEQTKWINLTILVSDNGRPYRRHSYLNFYCKIEDLNDNQPKFIQLNTTEFRLLENVDSNTVIFKFTAVDPDSGDFGTVIYKILSGGDGKFDINQNDGTLYVKSQLDREEQDLYTLVIQARDNPFDASSHQLSDSLMIKIKILDINDNSPFCERDIYYVETVQNVHVNTILVQVKGIDHDIGKNGQLSYSIRSDNESSKDSGDLFRINPENGQLQTNRKLFGHSGVYLYTVSIKDNTDSVKNSNYHTGSCKIRILIKEYNAHPPKFIYPNARNSFIRIKASLPFGAYILTVNATDEDKGQNGEVIYHLDETRIKNNDWKSFSLDPKSGVLTLNTKLNINKQSVYAVDVIASDMGKPTKLHTRITVTFILVDDSNNAAQFNRMQICLMGTYQCEKDYQSLNIRLREEQEPENVSIPLKLAKMSDLVRNDDDICYYLTGPDKEYFKLNKTSAILKPSQKLDRESKEKYEIIIKASEYCFCNGGIVLSEEQEKQCNLMNLYNDTFDINDISQIRVRIYLEDVNDNLPKFNKNFYQIGITSDIGFDEPILESFATDFDISSNLNFSIIQSSLITNMDKTNDNQPVLFPFSIEFFESQLNRNNSKYFKYSKFLLKTQQYFRETQFINKQNKNVYFQFNVSVFDQDLSQRDSCIIQVILISKQQRVKLVFSQSLEKVIGFQEEFQTYISNLTGFKAYIDKISVHRSNEEDYEDNVDSDSSGILNPVSLTDMFLHFIDDPGVLCIETDPKKQNKSSSKTDKDSSNMIVNADTILSLLDRTKDSNLLRKYKLSLAEKYDDQGTSTFYKYGSSVGDDDFGNFFQWTPNQKAHSTLITRVLLIILCILFLFLCSIVVIVCCCLRQKYKRKLKAERAMIKAFGLEQRSLNYNDAISGYVNSAFDSNSLLPIPGTNLYAYEGSNPIWLKKYDKIDIKNNPASSGSSSASTTSSSNETSSTSSCNNQSGNNKSGNNAEDISSFYLKQVDSTPATSRSSPTSNMLNNLEKNSGKNSTMTSEILSLQNVSTQDVNLLSKSLISTNTMNSGIQQHVPNLSSFKTDTLLTFASINNSSSLNQKAAELAANFKNQIKNLQTSSFGTNNHNNVFNSVNSNPKSILFGNGTTSTYTKIFDTYQQSNHLPELVRVDKTSSEAFLMEQTHDQKSQLQLQQQSVKDYCDLFAVESTVI